MRRNILAAVVFAALMGANAFAANVGDEIPFREGEPMPPAPSGMAWCLIQKPAVYDTVTETVTVRPPASFQVPVPGEYATKNEVIPSMPAYRVGRVVPAQFQPQAVPYTCQEAYTMLEVTPPEFKDEAMEVEICPAFEQITIIPAQFRDVPKRLLCEPARKSFQQQACEDGNLCWTVCETPAKYRDVMTKELVADAKEQRVPVPAKKQTVMVRKVARPAQVREVKIPAKQATYQKSVVSAPARVEWQNIPAQSQTVPVVVETKAPSFTNQNLPEKKETITKRVLKAPASMVWRLQGAGGMAPQAAAPAPSAETEYGSVPGFNARYSFK